MSNLSHLVVKEELVRDEIMRTVDSGRTMTHLLWVHCVPLTDTAKQHEARFKAALHLIVNGRLFVMDTAAPAAPLTGGGPLTESSVHMRWLSEEGCCVVYYANSAASTVIVSQITKRIVAGAYTEALRHTNMIPDDVRVGFGILSVLENGVLPAPTHGFQSDLGNR
jgi:hypothetical protein